MKASYIGSSACANRWLGKATGLRDALRTMQHCNADEYAIWRTKKDMRYWAKAAVEEYKLNLSLRQNS